MYFAQRIHTASSSLFEYQYLPKLGDAQQGVSPPSLY
jgi:hypothetical protein